MKKHIKDESGVAVVEASIYLPVVIAIVFFLVYLAFFYMEEFAMFYVVERAASEAARETAYVGYTQLGMNKDGAFEFKWSGDTPSKNEVESYNKSRYSNPNNLDEPRIEALYRELGRWNDPDYSDLETKYNKILKDTSMISIGSLTTPEIKMERGFFNSEVVATVSHTFHTPGIMQYVGAGKNITITSKTKKLAICPADFVRTVDLGADLVEFLLDKFDKGGNVRGFIDKVKTGIDKIL